MYRYTAEAKRNLTRRKQPSEPNTTTYREKKTEPNVENVGNDRRQFNKPELVEPNLLFVFEIDGTTTTAERKPPDTTYRRNGTYRKRSTEVQQI